MESERPLSDLPPRGKEPNSKRVLDTWIAQASAKTGIIERRLGWLVASSVLIATLQRAVGSDARPRFLVKGGVYLELKLGLHSRATADVDMLFRGDFDNFLDVLDQTLAEPWGVLHLQRTPVEEVDRAHRLVKPRRFEIKLMIRGTTWRSIKVEVSPDEGKAGERVEELIPPRLEHFGLSSPDELAGIAMNYQVAQKLHACTDPHDPPHHVNDRARDVVDLLLIKAAFYPVGHSLVDLRQASVDLFDSRANEANLLRILRRTWPPVVIPHASWDSDWKALAKEVGLPHSLDQAVTALNAWIAAIDAT